MVIMAILCIASPHSFRSFILTRQREGGRRFQTSIMGAVKHAFVCTCVSHVAVEALQKQPSVCVQKLCDRQILVHHSHHYLQTIGCKWTFSQLKTK